MYTLDFDNDIKNSEIQAQSLAYRSFFSSGLGREKTSKPTSVGVTDWAICANCRKGLNKKNAIDEIQSSEEFKKFVDKVRKVSLASTIISGLEESEVKADVDNKTYIPNSFLNKYSNKKRTLFGKLLGTK
jgi:hypothetical protein